MTDLVDSDGNKSALEGVGQLKLAETDYLEFVQGGGWTLGSMCPSTLTGINQTSFAREIPAGRYLKASQTM